jgi:hypothetical protein
MYLLLLRNLLQKNLEVENLMGIKKLINNWRGF